MHQEHGRLYALIQLGGQQAEAVIDTGASRSFVSTVVAERMVNPGSGERVTTVLQITMADGISSQIFDAIRTEVRLGESSHHTVLHVMPGTIDDIIIGLDTLGDMGAAVSCGGSYIVLTDPFRQSAPTPCVITPPVVSDMSEPTPTSDAPPKKTRRRHQRRTKTRDNKPDRTNHGSSITQTSANVAYSNCPHNNHLDLLIKTTRTVSRNYKNCVTFECSETWQMLPGSSNPIAQPSQMINGNQTQMLPQSHCATAFITRPEQGHDNRNAQTGNHQNEADRIREFLMEELKKFETMTGVTNEAEHSINVTDDRAIKQRYFPRNPAMQSIINTEIDELLAKGCIEPSRSPHSAPIVLARKTSGKWRLCVDYRQLNARSVPDAYPLPRIQHILDKLRRAKYISSLDLKHDYWQIPLKPDSRPYTAFTVPGRGLFQWRVMPFGLHSALAMFQRALDQVIGPEMEPHAFAYIDEIIVIGSTFEEHIQNLREVLLRLQCANLRINTEKCDFFKKELHYLGHAVSDKGIHTDPEKVPAIQELKPPTNVKEVRQYLGTAGLACAVQRVQSATNERPQWPHTHFHRENFNTF
ncbi:uncharacterized protein [Eurosta solidaginis]|uniref:uncharacterized protein n=1 Tax=Eurosta solidaginis TaxID=178769 RepID=UPI003530BEE6